MANKLEREIDVRQDDRWVRVLLLVLQTLFTLGVIAIAITEDDPWSFLALTVMPFSAFVRSKWAISRWPFLGPKNLCSTKDGERK